MSLSSTTDRVTVSGDGSTVDFSFPYKLISQSDLVVGVNLVSTGVQTTKVLTTHYTISGTLTNNIYESGVTVTFITAPASGYTVYI